MIKTVKIGLFLLISGCLLTSALYSKESYPIILRPHPLPNINTINIIKSYFENFEALAKSENWKEIISQGTVALDAAKILNNPHDEAKICAQLTSTAFYLGDYTQALVYANRCHELSGEFEDPSLFLRALYLESAVCRALAAKQDGEQAQQASYLRAVEIAEEAVLTYSKENIKDENLKGKIYFNLGAAHADNPKGDLEKAANCYLIALECFKNMKANDDVIRTGIRLGKVHLLQEKYGLSQKIIDEVRIQIKNKRLTMQADYLEAQLKFALDDIEMATSIAKNGLVLAIELGAKEDELRLKTLLGIIEKRR